MDFKKFYSLFLIILLVFSCKKEIKFFYINGETQGTTYSIKYSAETEKISKKSIDSLLHTFDLSLSTYIEESLISKINNGDSSLVVDTFFKETFEASRQIFTETNGVFDPTIGVLVNAYGFGPSKKNIVFTQEKRDSLLQYVGFDKVKLNPNNTITKQHPETYFDFNAIAQGYAVDVLSDFLKSKNIENAIIEIGGEVFAFGKNTIANKAWRVGIDHPLQNKEKRNLIATVQLTNLGLATSGNYRKIKTDSITGEKYVHTIHPKLGKPIKSNIISSTVLASTCKMADGYATALMVMSLEESKQFLDKHPEIYAILFYLDNENRLQKFQTKNSENVVTFISE